MRHNLLFVCKNLLVLVLGLLSLFSIIYVSLLTLNHYKYMINLYDVPVKEKSNISISIGIADDEKGGIINYDDGGKAAEDRYKNKYNTLLVFVVITVTIISVITFLGIYSTKRKLVYILFLLLVDIIFFVLL
ncbi:MAG: hypothetical protein MJ108_08130 [Saccharofermentans sp.]|nr:hypothetical protein [Saccharofermentans sp.]